MGKRNQEQGVKSSLGRVPFQGTQKTTLFGAMSIVGLGDKARELGERGTWLPRTRDPEGTLGWGAPELCVRNAAGEVTTPGKWKPDVGTEGMRGFPSRPDGLRVCAPLQPGPTGPRVPGGGRARQSAPSRAGALLSSPQTASLAASACPAASPIKAHTACPSAEPQPGGLETLASRRHTPPSARGRPRLP